MPAHHWIAYLFAATAVVGAGTAGIYTALSPQPEPVQRQLHARTIPEPILTPAPKAAPESPPAPVLKKTASPSFDVVRVEKDGNGVIAGRAEPGWKVIVASNDDEIAHAVADRNGEWAVVLDRPLSPGEHSISLRSSAPEGNRGFVSDQKVAVSIARPQKPERTIVALSQPGKATRLLTPPEPEPAESSQPKKAKPELSRIEESQMRQETAAVQKQEKKPAAAIDEMIEKTVEREPTAQATTARLPAQSATPEIVVSFDAVDYELNDDGKGKLFLSGQAEAGARVTLYLDNNLVGEAVAGSNGAWVFQSLRTLPPEKLHTMRADARQSDGQVASRAEVPFTPPAPAKSIEIAAAPELPKEPPRHEKQEKAQRVAADPDESTTGSVINRSATPDATIKAPKTVAAAPEESTAISEVNKPAPAAIAAVPQKSTVKQQAAVTASVVPAMEPRQDLAKQEAIDATAPESATAPVQEPVTGQAAAPETNTPAQIAVEPQKNTANKKTFIAAAVAPAMESEKGSSKQKPEPVVAAAAQPESKAASIKVDTLQQKRSIVVRRGDTLWHIARRRYGRGIRYTAIYRNNRDQIRNPHLIYPGQEFQLPVR